ncbi:calcium-translocating P-type ATPase, SERCA-type [Brevibacillus sp. SYSU BS000544]|uniref:calcium-translocating P-type ATPase, SERCA-type n=1 Tax=Brevibacillus sp. SYSU BS000544 TaxID=3416443 RepID=UPI003CE47C39
MKDCDAALNILHSDRSGLTEQEADKRKAIYGKNELMEGKKKSLFEMILEQFKNVMVIILLIAALVSGVLHELTDSIIILVVVSINAILGVIQERKAEKSLEALKQMSSLHAKVKRDGEVKQINSEDLVPGDIVLLEAGDYVPADMRLLQCSGLKVEEAALTGESVPVEKTTETLDVLDLVIGDRKNMSFAGSIVTYGRGTGIVTAIGMNTEIGKIASHLSTSVNQATPLQKKLAEMTRYLTVGIVIISVIIFLAGILQGRNYLDMFLISISLAVAAIPEGLPAVITIILALGVQRMAKRNAIIRKLSAVETLGSTEIICSDKTGTLTQNKMTVQEIFINKKSCKAEVLKTFEKKHAELFMQSLVLCNDSNGSHANSKVTFIGDPTETALAYFAIDNGYQKEQLDELIPRVGEIPFDSDRKLMTTIHSFGGHLKVITKGAPDVLLERCTGYLHEGTIEPFTSEHRSLIQRANQEMAGEALRVLALAYKDVEALPSDVSSETVEHEFVFVGLVGMIDPPREEAREAVRICKEAGIRPIMITGDHKDTAIAIAKQLQIIQDESEAITGSELNKLSDKEFEDRVSHFSVYARVSPEHKVKIVNTWKKQNKIIAMTGDGVNDAPALKASDIGIGMGITGTDVAKGASDMVLADDNFATIVVAVEEGRKIYSNLRKSIQFLLSSNLGEIVAIFIGTMLGWNILLPIHILWVNLVTDTLPALAIGMEKAEKDIMKMKPRKSSNSFFAEGMGISIVYQGIFKGLITLSAYMIGQTYYSHEVAVTMTFATLGLIQLTHALNVRSNTKSLLSIGVFTNKYLNLAIAISAFFQLVVIIVPYFNSLFKVQQLTWEQWLIVIASSLSIIPIVELAKVILNRKQDKTV